MRGARGARARGASAASVASMKGGGGDRRAKEGGWVDGRPGASGTVRGAVMDAPTKMMHRSTGSALVCALWTSSLCKRECVAPP